MSWTSVAGILAVFVLAGAMSIFRAFSAHRGRQRQRRRGFDVLPKG